MSEETEQQPTAERPPSRAERTTLAADPNTSTEELTRLARDESWRVRRAVAGNPEATPDVLFELAGDPIAKVRNRLAANPAATASTLRVLAGNPTPIVTERVAGHPATPLVTRIDLLANDDPKVVALAWEGLRDLQANDEETVEQLIVRLGELPTHARSLLATDPDTDPAILIALARDSGTTLDVLAKHPALPAEALAEMAKTDRGARIAAAHPSTPIASLEQLVRTDDRGPVAALVATNPALPVDLQRKLAKSKSWYVRAGLAANPSTDGELVDRLAGDSEWAVRHELAGSPALTERAGSILIGDLAAVRLPLAANPETPDRTIATLIDDEDPWVRGVAARHRSVPATRLRDLAGDLDGPAWTLRAIADNPSCPTELADEIGAWIVLGGGDGDPEFDPVSCTGAPPGSGPDDAPAQVYRTIGQSHRPTFEPHPLWQARRYQYGTSPIHGPIAERVIRDPRPEIRLLALTFRTHVRPKALAFVAEHDPDPRAAAAAERATYLSPRQLRARTNRATGTRTAGRRANDRGWEVAAPLIGGVMGLVGLIGMLSGDDSTTVWDPDDFSFTTFTTFSFLPETLAPDTPPIERLTTTGGGVIEAESGTPQVMTLTVTAGDEPIEILNTTQLRLGSADRPYPIDVRPGETVELVFLTFDHGLQRITGEFDEGGRRQTFELRVLVDEFDPLTTTTAFQLTVPSTALTIPTSTTATTSAESENQP